MVKITKDNFKSIIDNNDVVIIDFWAPWCNPCVALGPIMEDVAKNYPNITFGKVNVDEEEELAMLFKISSIPYVVKIINGKMVNSFLGLHDESYVDEFFRN